MWIFQPLRTSLQTAFHGALELGPTPDFVVRLRRQLADGAAITARQRGLPRQWLALAAMLIVVVGLWSRCDAERSSGAIAVGGFTVLTAPAADHVLLLVSDLTRQDLEPLAQVMSNLLVPQIKAADSISVPDARTQGDAIAAGDVPPTFRCERQPSRKALM
jgi:hypothetical protein